MSGIAEVLARQGFPVSGSDLHDSETTKKLHSIGVRVHIGHQKENLEGAKVVVVSSAINRDNPEIREAERLGLPIVARAEMLAELMRLRFGVAVAGTHGKTTTTSMLASILAHAGEDPTVVVGGKVDALGGNAKLGQGRFFVAEADESDGSFLHLSPVVTIVTNIDNDHLDFFGQMERLRMAFLEFINQVPYYGRSILCGDDPEIAKLLPLVTKPHWTYGFSSSSNFHITNFKSLGLDSTFDLLRDGKKLCSVSLGVPGRHNALNAVGALAAAIELDLDLEKALDGLKNFSGVRRRFEVKGQFNGATIIDDYGHHPTEILATLQSARLYRPEARVLVAFQPHRYTRTQSCWEQFGDALGGADQVFLLDIYPAGERPIHGVHSEKLASQIPRCQYVGSLDKTQLMLRDQLKPGDLLITLGAGSITSLGPALMKE